MLLDNANSVRTEKYLQEAQSGLQQDAPSLFPTSGTLGLKLEPREELIDVVVIDHLDGPTPN